MRMNKTAQLGCLPVLADTTQGSDAESQVRVLAAQQCLQAVLECLSHTSSEWLPRAMVLGTIQVE